MPELTFITCRTRKLDEVEYMLSVYTGPTGFTGCWGCEVCKDEGGVEKRAESREEAISRCAQAISLVEQAGRVSQAAAIARENQSRPRSPPTLFDTRNANRFGHRQPARRPFRLPTCHRRAAGGRESWNSSGVGGPPRDSFRQLSIDGQQLARISDFWPQASRIPPI